MLVPDFGRARGGPSLSLPPVEGVRRAEQALNLVVVRQSARHAAFPAFAFNGVRTGPARSSRLGLLR
jgi:hypothetical protein